MAEPKTTQLRRPERESGQALVEAVLLSLVIAMIACAALEFGTYFYVVNAADAATTEAARACLVGESPSESAARAAAEQAAKGAGELRFTYRSDGATTENYTHYLPKEDGSSGWDERASTTTFETVTVKAEITRKPMTALGKAVGLAAGTGGTYTVTSERTFQADQTTESRNW